MENTAVEVASIISFTLIQLGVIGMSTQPNDKVKLCYRFY